MNDRVAAALDRLEIEDIVRRYCRGIDRRDFELVRRCFHPDATDQHGAEPRSLDEFIAWVDQLTETYQVTQHLVTGVLVDIGDDYAAAESTGVAVHRGKDPSPERNLITGFRYLDRFERRAGRWAIAARTGVAEWAIPIPAARWWELPTHHPQSRRDRDDPLYALLGSLGLDL